MDLKFVIESLLFTSQKPLSPSELRDVLNKAAEEDGAEDAARALKKTPLERIEDALQELTREHEAANRTYRLVCVAGSWQFVTQPDYAPWLRAFVGVKNRPARLSQPGLETLAIIAYRQPITRAEIEQIRGVAVDGVVATLLERNLITQAGRAEVVGRPMTYATTPAFLEYFGLADLDGLPAADELRRIPVQRPDSLLTVDSNLATAPPDLTGGTPVQTEFGNPEIPSATPLAASEEPPIVA
ncbi:MAG: SMC-Scp complex subunit ScpB [Pedosphaera sp.]|nr:SMC-Scp complex subunit ScpB [Pedosphaera sp.]